MLSFDCNGEQRLTEFHPAINLVVPSLNVSYIAGPALNFIYCSAGLGIHVLWPYVWVVFFLNFLKISVNGQ